MKKLITVLMMGLAIFSISCSSDTSTGGDSNAGFTIPAVSGNGIVTWADIQVDPTKDVTTGGAMTTTVNRVAAVQVAMDIEPKLQAVTTDVEGYDLATSTVAEPLGPPVQGGGNEMVDVLVDVPITFTITLKATGNGANKDITYTVTPIAAN